MNLDQMISMTTRLFFLAAFGLFGIAVVERLVNLFGFTLLGGTYTAGRLLDFAVILLMFVVALLLRQMREGLTTTR